MIPLAEPDLGKGVQLNALQALESGHVGPDGPFVREFEERVAEASGHKWAIATITGSAALHASAKVLGFQDFPKQDVAVPLKGYPAMKNILNELGCDVSELSEGSENHDCYEYKCLKLGVSVADCAPAIGEKCPVKANLECYSFAANKTITCGHGGAIVGDDWDLYEQCHDIIYQRHNFKAGIFNYRMANINAAIGCSQIRDLPWRKSMKRGIWERYLNAGFKMIDRGPSRWMSTIDPEMDPYVFSKYMRRHLIETKVEPSGGVSLPCSTTLTAELQKKVINLAVRCLSVKAVERTQAP